MLYGHHTGGLFGYSHLTGGWDGGQAEYARVPFGARPLHNRLALPVLLHKLLQALILLCRPCFLAAQAAQERAAKGGKHQQLLARNNRKDAYSWRTPPVHPPSKPRRLAGCCPAART